MADLGQVFTKGNVARYMVSLLDLPTHAAILEPCFGTGSFLNALKEKKYTQVTACEIDAALFKAAKSKYNPYELIHTDFLAYHTSAAYDGIVMNPPYIRQEKIDELEKYGITKQKLQEDPVFRGLPSTANLYMYFIMKAIALLKQGGQLIVIFPSSWMNTRTGTAFGQLMLSKCGIEKQVYIFGEVFEKEAIVEVAILKLRKGKTSMAARQAFLQSKDGKLIVMPAGCNSAAETFSYPFSRLATIKRGLGTGFNAMYINPALPDAAGQCCKPILSSPKNINGYSTRNARFDRAFSPASAALTDDVVKYLEFWKGKIIKEKKPKSLHARIMRGGKWYGLREIRGEGILFSYIVRSDMKFVMDETGTLIRDNFYIITPKVDKWVLFALLNNYYTYYQLELSGKRYGAGLLKLQKYDIEKLTFPQYDSLSENDKKDMMKLSRRLVATSDPAVIGEITKLIAKYSRVQYEDIASRYFSARDGRLEVR